MTDIRVQILNVTVPSQFEDTGGVFVDLDSPQMSLSRVAEELNEINLIKFGGVRQWTVPATAKNMFIFREFIAASPIDFDYTPLECRIFVGGNVLRESKIGASDYDEASETIELIATKANDYWIIGASALRLPQIPYEDIEFSQATIEASHAAGPEYGDGDVGIFFPYAYYGKPFLDRQFTVEYMRWTYHLLRLLREGMRTFGWCFECEALESTVGRRIHAYLIDPNAYENQELIEANRAVAETGEFSRAKQWTISGGGLFGGGSKLYGYHWVALFDNEVFYDPGSNMLGGRYYGFGVFKFSVTFQYIPEEFGNATVVKCQFFRNDPGGPVAVYEDSFTPIDEFTGARTDVHQHVFESEVSLGANQSITVAIYTEVYSKNLTVHNMLMRVDPVTVYPQRGETLNPANYLRNDTLLEVLKGWVHVMRGKLDVVPGERTVRVMPNYGVDDTFWGTLEAYYRDTLIDVGPYQIHRSSGVSAPTSKPDRYQVIRWAPSTDPSIKALGLDKLTPLYSKTIDLGSQYPEGRTEYANPYFEPTNSDWIYDFSPEGYEHIPVNLPILLDHIPEEGSKKISTDIGPRIFYIHTAAGQSFPLESGLALCRLGWEGTEVTSWSTAYMRNAFLPSTADQMNLVFGDPLGVIENTIGNIFWRGWIYGNIAASKIRALVDMKPGQFFGWSFRDAYAVISRGNTVIGNLIAIDDFDPGSGISTPITLIPRSLTGVVSTGDQDDVCQTYSYQLAITLAGTTYTFTVTTDNPEHPAESTVEWRYEGVGTWTEAGSLADPTGPFYVRFNIEGDCPYTIVKYVDPCGNVPSILIDFEVDSMGQNCVTATIGGLLLDPIDSTSLEYDLDGADSWSAYTPGTEICGSFTEICFRGTIDFDNPCDPYDLAEQCFEIPPDTDCNLNNPQIEIIHDGLDSFRFDMAGSWDSDIGSFHFFYKHTGEDDKDAKRWTDQNPIVGTDYLVKMHVFWCDDCPPVCTDWVAVEEPAPLMAALQTAESSPWDFSKIPDDRKKEIKNLIYTGKKADLARIHNELELSEYEYCCGPDLGQAMKWFRWGMDKGYLDTNDDD